MRPLEQYRKYKSMMQGAYDTNPTLLSGAAQEMRNETILRYERLMKEIAERMTGDEREAEGLPRVSGRKVGRGI